MNENELKDDFAQQLKKKGQKHLLLTLEDIKFYGEYQKEYFDSNYPESKYRRLEVFDLVQIRGSKRLGIVQGLSGVPDYYSVMRYDERAERFWTCGMAEINISWRKTRDHQKRIKKYGEEYIKLFDAFLKWTWGNNINICTAEFRDKWNKYKDIKEGDDLMFSNEIIVKGNYVSGTIKKNDGNKDSSNHPYILHSGLNFGGRGGTTWTADKMREIAKEILDVAAEMDKQNNTIKCPE